jgi:NADPH:quinone reductase-like Zn-dependent oxidoreductase
MRAIVIQYFGGFDSLKELGVDRTEIEGPDLSERIAESARIDAVLDLVDNSTFLDSLRMLLRGGRVCLAGRLGELDPVNSFNPLLQMPSQWPKGGSHLSFLISNCARLSFQSYRRN